MRFSKSDIRLLDCEARISPLNALNEQEVRFASAMERAGAPPLITDGHPTIARVVAWLGHEGENRNGLVFLKDELPAAAARIKEPNFLPMDFNHSATTPPDSGLQRAIGVWYRADFAFDPMACMGKGAWGILATGMMWSWMNPDYANEMLMDQARRGYVRFSMACIPTSSEMVPAADDSGRMMEIAHNPVFFTLSALNVPNADADANGIVAEGDARPDLEAWMRDHLQAPESIPHPMDSATNMPDPTFYHVGDVYTDAPGSSGVAPHKDQAPSDKQQKPPVPTVPNREPGPIPDTPRSAAEILKKWAASYAPKEGQMDELLAFLKDHVASKETLDEMKASLEQLRAMIEAAKPAPNTDDDEDDQKVAKDKPRPDGEDPDYVEKAVFDQTVANLDAAKQRVAELETALTAAKDELTKAVEAAQTLEAQLGERDTKLAEYHQAELEAAASVMLKTRVGSLPDAYRAAHEKRDDRQDVEARWMKKSDEEWAEFLADISLPVTMRKSYLERSEDEGRLAGAGTLGDSDTTKGRLSKYIN